MHALPLPAEAEDLGDHDDGGLKNMNRVQICWGSEQGQITQSQRQALLSPRKCLYETISEETLPIQLGSWKETFVELYNRRQVWKLIGT